MISTSELSRRQLLKAGALCAVAQVALRPARLFGADAPTAAPTPPAPARGRAKRNGAEALYSFVLLGDIHYDAPHHHDMDWVRKEKPGDVRQIENYCKVTADHTPRLIGRVKQVIQQSAAPVAFVIQNGDLVEGLCGSAELHTVQMREALALIDQAAFGVPFLASKGNHDITGPGARETYDTVMLPWLSKQAGQTITSSSFVQRHGDDAFIFFDAYKPNVDWLEQALKQHADARRTFFFTHPPVVPSDARANWCLFGFVNESASRQRVLDLLGARGVMVFTGHLHKQSFIERQTSNGRFWEMGTCSVVRSNPVRPIKLAEGIDQYGEQLTDLEPKFTPSTLEERKSLLRAEKPFVRQYMLADVPGYTVVHVFPDGVQCEVFAGTDTQVWDTREAELGARV